eukprot:TRINITY_DN36001_c0_g1_i1.p1 TRINITY_DN36001_c0_g1~~TRINITY_DN36001_c0_g1_i1.p1  ORF type:complete len:977 (+),score=301.70 TRINITY_DN36001_c0_g1_i1:47-2932(+)
MRSAILRQAVLTYRRRRVPACLALVALVALVAVTLLHRGSTPQPVLTVPLTREQSSILHVPPRRSDTTVSAARHTGERIVSASLRGHNMAADDQRTIKRLAAPVRPHDSGVVAGWRGKTWTQEAAGGVCEVRLLPHSVWHVRWRRPGSRSHSDVVLDAPATELRARAVEAEDVPGMLCSGGSGGKVASAARLASADDGDGGVRLEIAVFSEGNSAVRATLRRVGGGPAIACLDIPRGNPEAAVSFPQAKIAIGLPERATPLTLSSARYRLWNLDVNHYRVGSTDPLYGIVPLVTGVQPGGAAAVLWLNPSETNVDVRTAEHGVEATYRGRAGMGEVLLLPGGEEGAMDVVQQMTAATGAPFMPPMWSLGYHQCRWNYRDEMDVKGVNSGFDEHGMPCDAIWLDIDHTDNKRYFTWDPRLFRDPQGMQQALTKSGRRLVTITDPHIARHRGYRVHDEAESLGHYVKSADGRTSYRGHCWPGDSSWVDFLSPAARDWYAEQFTLDHYQGATKRTHVWIDMNEPSVFSGPETTMHGNALHAGSIPHSEVHNIYGHLHSMAAAAGLKRRFASEKDPAQRERGFILTRSFFAGTQRYAAVWTGDNQALWSHLAASVPMLLSMSAAGIPFVGADVGGFFDNPEPELLARWYQLGVTYPFFRGHSHHDTHRREPWLISGASYKRAVSDALRLRYALVPYIYTAFWRCVMTGAPPMRAMLLEFPHASEDVLRIDDQFLLGPALLAAPVLQRGAASRSVRFPGPAVGSGAWYDFRPPHRLYTDGDKPETVPVDIYSIPLFQRAGTIVLLKEADPGDYGIKSTADLRHVPYTAQVAITEDISEAEGDLFLDDGSSYNYTAGGFNHKLFTYRDRVFSVTCAHGDNEQDGDGEGEAPKPSKYQRPYPPDVPYTPAEPRLMTLRVLGLSGDVVARIGDGDDHRVSQGKPIPGGIEFKRLLLPVQGPWAVRIEDE